MKTIIALAFVLVASLASATELAVPKNKTAMAKSPPPVVRPLPVIPGETCIQRVERICQYQHRRKVVTKAFFVQGCMRRERGRCL